MRTAEQAPPAIDWMTFRETCDYLRVSAKTLQRYIDQERIPRPSRVGRKLLWNRAKLHAHVESLEA